MYSCLAAMVDSAERFDAPRCEEETWEAMQQQLEDWANGIGSMPKVMWVFGGAGAGKSALAQTLAETFQKMGKLAASFFFSRSAAGRSDGNALIPTLVLQLVESIPELKAAVAEATKAGDKASTSVRDARGKQQKKMRAMQLNKSVRPDDLKKAGTMMEKVVEKGSAELKKVLDNAKKVLESG